MNEDVIVKSILECVDELLRSYGSNEGVVSGFRTRARTVPQEAFSRGLSYALVYVAARSNVKAVEKGLVGDRCSEVIEQVSKNTGSEELPYGLYGAILLYTLRKTDIIPKSENTFTKVLMKVIEDPSIEARSWLVLDWLKRIAEAYIHG